MGNLRYGNYDLGACETTDACDAIAAEIAILIAAETDDHIRACMKDERRRFTNKSWGFRNPGGKNGTVSSPRARRAPVVQIDPNAHTVQIPVCDPATRAAIIAQIDAFVAQIDPNAVRIAGLRAERERIDAEIAAYAKIAKTAKKTA